MWSHNHLIYQVGRVPLGCGGLKQTQSKALQDPGHPDSVSSSNCLPRSKAGSTPVTAHFLQVQPWEMRSYELCGLELWGKHSTNAISLLIMRRRPGSSQAQEPHALDSPAFSDGALWDEVWAGWVGGSLTG